MTSLSLTGERTLPSATHEAYWFARHDAVYRWVANHVGTAERWLDAGSGEGYGTARLAAAGARVVGIELDASAAQHATRRYAGSSFVRANLVAVPLVSASFDAVVSFQVIEHMWDVASYLRELVRVGRAGAHIFVSTPNRPVFSPGLGRGERPTNPFHVEEFDADQLASLMHQHGLHDVHVHGLTHGARIIAWESDHGSLVAAQVAAATNESWPADLDAFVDTVTADDFAITYDTATAQDLIAVGQVA